LAQFAKFSQILPKFTQILPKKTPTGWGCLPYSPSSYVTGSFYFCACLL